MPEENARFARKHAFPFSLLSDPDRRIAMAFGASDGPTDEFARRIAYVIDQNGRVDEAHPKVDARTYPQEQLLTI